MLNIELVRFEAQDVITTSVAAVPCDHSGADWIISENHTGPQEWEWSCDCGESGVGFPIS